MTKGLRIVHDEWDVYVAERDGVTMFIAFDDAVTRGKPPVDLKLCARIWLRILHPNAAGGPDEPESAQLYDMEDELVALLKKHRAPCRLVGRLTYGGLREIVFQVHDWKSFRTPVGLWIMRHQDYEIEVYEHRGWKFFNDYIRPRIEDRLFIADRNVVDSLIDGGSNPRKKHDLEYSFRGDATRLKRLATRLIKRGYKPLGELDFDTGRIELVKRMALDLTSIVQESVANHRAAAETGVEFDGWGAAVVQ